MPNPNDFVLHSGYASFKNEIGSLTQSVTLPAGQTISAGGTFTNTDTGTLGSQGSSIYSKISPSRPTYITPSTTVDYAGDFFVGASLFVYWPFEINDGSGNITLVTIAVTISRPSSTQVRTSLQIANFNPSNSITNTGGAITFTSNIQTYLSPFEE